MSNNRSAALAAIIVVVLAVGSYLFIFADSSGSTSTDSNRTSDGTTLADQYPNLEGGNIGEEVDATDQSQVEISINDFIYEESVVTVSVGTTVTWVNDGAVRHDVTTDDTSEITDINSELLANGETFTHTFEQSGEFNYYCSPHPFQMRGVIVVQ